MRRGSNQEVRGFVNRKVVSLQERHLSGDPRASAELARLRRAVGSFVGDDPSTWGLTLEGFPEEVAGRGDRASREEVAAHMAITMHALHQQSKQQPMHVSGTSFGSAVASLARATREVGVERRFYQVGTSDSFEELGVHLRGLVTQMRSAGIALDYAALASDMVDVLNPHRAGGVRLRWGRDYHRTRGAQEGSSSKDQTQADQTEGEDK